MFADAKQEEAQSEPTVDTTEEEQIEPTQEETTIPEPTKEESEVDDKLQAYIDFLKDNELVDIPEELEFKGTPDQLQQVFQYTKQKRQQEALVTVFNSLPDDFKPYLNMLLVVVILFWIL
jgi:hypothetical protein